MVFLLFCFGSFLSAPAEKTMNQGGGGVIWTKGATAILGGSFSNNSASEGGVVFAGEAGMVTLTGTYILSL